MSNKEIIDNLNNLTNAEEAKRLLTQLDKPTIEELKAGFQGMNIGNRHACSLLNQLSLKFLPKTAPDNRVFSLFPKLLPVHKQYLHQT